MLLADPVASSHGVSRSPVQHENIAGPLNVFNVVFCCSSCWQTRAACGKVTINKCKSTCTCLRLLNSNCCTHKKQHAECNRTCLCLHVTDWLNISKQNASKSHWEPRRKEQKEQKYRIPEQMWNCRPDETLPLQEWPWLQCMKLSV